VSASSAGLNQGFVPAVRGPRAENRELNNEIISVRLWTLLTKRLGLTRPSKSTVLNTRCPKPQPCFTYPPSLRVLLPDHVHHSGRCHRGCCVCSVR
jgi:hypothetical protein